MSPPAFERAERLAQGSLRMHMFRPSDGARTAQRALPTASEISRLLRQPTLLRTEVRAPLPFRLRRLGDIALASIIAARVIVLDRLAVWKKANSCAPFNPIRPFAL